MQENLNTKILLTGLEMYKVGIVGMGFVGKAIFHGFSLFCETKGYDIDPKKSTHSLDEVLNSDFVFVCLPTPESIDGSADLTYIHNFFNSLENKNPIFILKSTVPVGTTSDLELLYSINIVHSPEFLSARTADIDFITTNRVIIGSNKIENSEKVKNLFDLRFPGINKVITSPNESELIKYFLNCFFSTKISFFNEMRLLSDKLYLNWDNIMNGVLSDGRIEKMHTDVPGHDGKFGFGGACFPKDTKALRNIFIQNEIEPFILNSVITQNNLVRNNLSDIKWGGSGIEFCLYEYLTSKFPEGTKMLELGSGAISTRTFSTHFDLTTVEEDFEWLNKFPVKYIHAPIKDGWYDVELLSQQLDSDYRVVFVDGPLGEGNRVGLLNNLHLFNDNITWVFHDTFRDSEKNLAIDLAKKTNKNLNFFSGCDYWAIVE